jgi:hypothetical protein
MFAGVDMINPLRLFRLIELFAPFFPLLGDRSSNHQLIESDREILTVLRMCDCELDLWVIFLFFTTIIKNCFSNANIIHIAEA